jgi:hypothetical protein
MTIETKFLIGLFVLMFIGSFMAGFISTDCTHTPITAVQQKWTELGNSFTNINVKSILNITYQVGSFLWTVAWCVGSMILWDFCFFENYNWLRGILIAVNMALLLKILFDLWRAAKPFGG